MSVIKFRDLCEGIPFEFANRFSGMEAGPWVKTSKRIYEPASVLHRLSGHRIEVGTINVMVETCNWPEV
jgi:hypothetical protein